MWLDLDCYQLKIDLYLKDVLHKPMVTTMYIPTVGIQEGKEKRIKENI